MTDPLTLAAAVLVGTIATARATRLLIADAYPPAAALRRWWFNQTVAKGGWRAGWAPLLTDDEAGNGCPFCAAPYIAAVNLGWVLAAGLEWGPFWSTAWWVVNLWAAVAYAAAMIVARDEPPADPQ